MFGIKRVIINNKNAHTKNKIISREIILKNTIIVVISSSICYYQFAQQVYCNLVRVGIQQPHQSLLVCAFYLEDIMNDLFELFPFLPCAIAIFALVFGVAVIRFGKKEMR